MTKEKAMEVIEDFEMAKAQRTSVKQGEVSKLLRMLQAGKLTNLESKIVTAGEELRSKGKDITPYNVGQLVEMPGHKVRAIMLDIGKKVAYEG